MKHVKLLLFAFTLMFSVSAIAAPSSDKTPKAKKEHKATTETTVDKELEQICLGYTGGTSTTDLQNPDKYVTPAGNPTCGPTSDIPCVVCVDSTNGDLYNSSTHKLRVESGTTLANAIAAKQTSGVGFTISYKTAP